MQESLFGLRTAAPARLALQQVRGSRLKIDLEQAEPSSYQSDVCICGAGIAGLTLASALLKAGLSVALLEGGGLATEKRSQDLYEVEMAGNPHIGASKGRFRIFGGSSTEWGGQLLPYSEDVFCPPDGSLTEPWPVASSELEPHYPEVLRIMGVPDEPFLAGSLSSAGSSPPKADDDVQVRFSRWAPFSQRNLASTLGKRCVESPSITLYLHANVTRIEAGRPSDRHISQVHVTNFTGRRFTFSAQFIIVCLGVIESVRLLLLSELGNAGDQVGRYFHDHIGVHAATLRPPARDTAIRQFAPKMRAGVLYTPKLEATARWRRQFGTQAVMAHFPIVEPEDSGAATLRMLLQVAQRRKWPAGLAHRLAKLPLESIELLRMAYSTKRSGRRAVSKRAEYRLHIDVEQRPDQDSRITLSETKDALGMPRARLDWKINEPERRTVELFAQKILNELADIGIAPIQMNSGPQNGDWLAGASDTYHMMGGTRMGRSISDSVVDANLKVHGTSNLFVASCSVFPSGGSSNPTFTMMALTLRLADLIRRLSGR